MAITSTAANVPSARAASRALPSSGCLTQLYRGLLRSAGFRSGRSAVRMPTAGKNEHT
jgi:hypothetical protein